jgi:hypothetical protein
LKVCISAVSSNDQFRVHAEALAVVLAGVTATGTTSAVCAKAIVETAIAKPDASVFVFLISIISPFTPTDYSGGACIYISGLPV